MVPMTQAFKRVGPLGEGFQAGDMTMVWLIRAVVA
jgi:hypothetical protein